MPLLTYIASDPNNSHWPNIWDVLVTAAVVLAVWLYVRGKWAPPEPPRGGWCPFCGSIRARGATACAQCGRSTSDQDFGSAI